MFISSSFTEGKTKKESLGSIRLPEAAAPSARAANAAAALTFRRATSQPVWDGVSTPDTVLHAITDFDPTT